MNKKMNICIGPKYEILFSNGRDMVAVLREILEDKAGQLKPITNSMLVLPVIGDMVVSEWVLENDKMNITWLKGSPWINAWWMTEYQQQAIMQ